MEIVVTFLPYLIRRYLVLVLILILVLLPPRCLPVGAEG